MGPCDGGADTRNPISPDYRVNRKEKKEKKEEKKKNH